MDSTSSRNNEIEKFGVNSVKSKKIWNSFISSKKLITFKSTNKFTHNSSSPILQMGY